MQMHEIRRAIVGACLEMNRLGLNQGTSGNVSVRCGEGMLVTPTATPYDRLAPEMLASMRLSDEEGRFSGPVAPSSEWRFHRDIYRARPDVGAVVHCHATYATVLSMLRVNIPAAHYMVAAFGGAPIKCTDYAPYGTAELSALVVEGLGPRHGVLLGSHGMIATGADLDTAMWRAVELETLAKQYYLARAVGEPVVLSDAEIEALVLRFAGYGIKARD
ncbi:MAG: class aldolase [Hyphomicrobiales bacterium]|jgi:L-fuculose-phosphate aldolase|nr:class aldolase [Hyphomicrobiales bacterium]